MWIWLFSLETGIAYAVSAEINYELIVNFRKVNYLKKI